MSRYSLYLGILFITILSPKTAYCVGSGGIATEITSANSLSNLLTVTGSNCDASIVYTNPASISDLSNSNVTFGFSYLRVSAERIGVNLTSDKMETTDAVIPNFSIGINNGKIGIGLAIISPYGLETQWSDTSNVRYVATKSTLRMFNITPAVSCRLSDKFALGFGIDYYSTFDADLQKKVNVDFINSNAYGSAPVGAPDANSKLTGNGDQWGYHTGLLFNPTSNHTFGLAYHSEVKTKIEGELEIIGLSGAAANPLNPFGFGSSNFKTKARTDLFYPQNIQMGYKYSKDNKWEAGFNLAWYDWSANTHLEIVLPDATAAQRAIAGKPIPLQWRDVWSATIGGFYRLSDAWKLNMGAYYLPHVYPEHTFTPAVPDMDKIGLSIGPAFTKGSWGIDAVYNPLFYKTTIINNNIGQVNAGTAGDISGKYKAMVHIIGINVKYHY